VGSVFYTAPVNNVRGLQMTLCLYFLYETMGPCIFAGLAVMILLIPINAVIVRFTRRIQVKQMGIKVCPGPKGHGGAS
jgi:hypothetical protein